MARSYTIFVVTKIKPVVCLIIVYDVKPHSMCDDIHILKIIYTVTLNIMYIVKYYILNIHK